MQTNLDQVFQKIQHSPAWTPHWMKDLRQAAFKKFADLGFPNRSLEDWKYTSTKAISSGHYHWLGEEFKDASQFLADITIAEAQLLVFVNGTYASELSKVSTDSSISVRPLLQAIESNDAMLEKHLRQDKGRGSFEDLNQALLSSGAVININKSQGQLVQLLFINSQTTNPQIISPRNIVTIGQGISATIVESYFSFDEAHFTNALSEYFVAEAGHLHLYQEKILSSSALHVGSVHIKMAKDAKVDTFCLSLGGRMSRSQMEVDLAASGAELQMDGLYVSRHESHVDQTTSVQHLAPNTRSSQVYKGVLYDSSRSVFNGKIKIAKDAQQTVAHQLNKNLLMSDLAEADTRPQLSIDANDVKCSHGATIGQLDAMQTFYLQSRGIPKDEAEQILAKAFVRDVIYRIKQPFMQTRVLKLMNIYSGLTL